MKPESWRHRRWWLWIIGSLAFVGVAALAVWLIPELLVNWNISQSALNTKQDPLSNADQLAAISAARQGVLFAAGGVLAVITLLFTKRRDDVVLEKQELDRDANWTGRYSDAVEQLGHESLSVRLGGIYALARIAEDSRRDRQTVMEVLAAFLRERSPHVDLEAEWDRRADPVLTDIHSAATVLARITRLSPPANVLDLSHADLRGAQFAGANLTRASFLFTALQGADLSGAILKDARFERCNLSKAELDGASMDGLWLDHVIGREVSMVGATLDRANIITTDLAQAKLANASLRNARLTDTSLAGADLTRAVLQGAVLGDFMMYMVDAGMSKQGEKRLKPSKSNTKATGALNLTGAFLYRTDLSSAIAKKVIVTDALLNEARLGVEVDNMSELLDFEDAMSWNEGTTWPLDYAPSQPSKGRSNEEIEMILEITRLTKLVSQRLMGQASGS